MLKPEDVPGVQGYFRAAFGPEVIQAALPRGTVPIMVRGEYSRTVHKVGPAKPPAIFRALYVYIGMAVEGKGRFGKRILPVRVIDGNANWTLGDPWRPSGQDIRRGDTLAIDLGDGSFTKDVRKGCYGSPIEVDGAWYSVSLGETGKELTVAPLDVDLGKILVKHPEWSCMLIGKRNVFHLSGGVEPLVVPVDSYTITQHEQWEGGPADAKSKRPRLMCRGSNRRGAARPIVTVKGGKTTEVAIGSPMTASIIATRWSNGIVSLVLSLEDPSGREVTNLYSSNWRRPVGPEITIRDEAGKTVYKTLAEWGCVVPIRCLWQPPEGLVGELTVSLDYKTDPFEIKLKETTITLK